ncbi:MAG: phospholipase [Solirubrobacterales bacterium]|nr:phospholipase [Solirubrobacterales bacterium]
MIFRAPDHSDRRARGELADPELVERMEAEGRDELLRRREFLGRTAALAGVAGMAGVLPAETLVAEAAKRAARKPFPKPRDLPIDTFVVLMMENRSFDHYFGWHPHADGKNAGLSYPNLDHTQTFPTHRLTPDFQGCDFRDPNHGWDGGRFQLNGGKLDGFYSGNAEGTGSDEYALGYYLKEDLGFIPHVADAYQLYDRYFCSIMGGTYPNRHYQLSAQNGGQKSNLFPPSDPQGTSGFEWETILDRAQTRGVGVAYYVSDLPFPALYGQRGLNWVRPASQFYTDAATGQLPPICFIDPPFKDGGGGDGISADEHPHGDVRLGQAFMSDVAHAFIEGPQYKRGALFINYDEWGGFFDHVAPPHMPDDRANRADLENDWSLAGFRIPGVAVSPYTRADKGSGVSHMPCTHESILKLISYRYELGFLTKRHRYASNIGRSFDFTKRDFEPPKLPDPAAIAAIPCSAGGSARPKPHDLVGLETSGLLERLGYEVPKVTYDSLFRYPDRVRKAFEATEKGP